MEFSYIVALANGVFFLYQFFFSEQRTGEVARKISFSAPIDKSSTLYNLLAISSIVLGSLIFRFSGTTLFANAKLDWDYSIWGVICILIMWAGCYLRTVSMQVLGIYFTRVLTVQLDQKVVKDGPYKYVNSFLVVTNQIRHPGYVANFLVLYPYAAVVSCNWIFALIICTVHFIVYLYRVSTEEEMLCKSSFGREYKKYTKETKKFIPFVF